jgi:hypothetical protein
MLMGSLRQQYVAIASCSITYMFTIGHGISLPRRREQRGKVGYCCCCPYLWPQQYASSLATAQKLFLRFLACRQFNLFY